ncbi:MAG: bifunctional folylpolyglutamate synthase/dihydrofolate synthase [Bacteroidales bacterium]|nr:bifunctional folylpolyglutamate synthase/dihydrofolate synthase [Bacteroidales bacterium]
MNYQKTLDYMFSSLPMFQRIGGAAYKADLSNTIALCELLGNPQKNFKNIHIAGTNGKGSTSHMIASVFQEAGYKTGLYTSPHLRDFRERIRIDGKMITESHVIEFIEKYKSDFENIGLSFFEMTVGLAFNYFENQKVDIVILETGMGGRLDSTNIAAAELSVITNIGLDHTQFLGDTLEQIAGEKAGIIKKDIPVIIGQTQAEISHVFTNKAEKANTTLGFADQNYSAGIQAQTEDYSIIRMQSQKMDRVLELPLLGSYQKNNLITSIAAIDQMIDQGWEISEQNIKDGIRNVVQNTGLIGRWQKLQNNPKVICDTGHNMDGVRHIVDQLNRTDYNNLHFVLGMVNDKAIDKILNILPKDAVYYFCKANIPRGLDVDILSEQALTIGLKGEKYVSVTQALNAARKNAVSDDLIFIGGSTFTVAEVV